jgi:paired amphipathic helix protein Sin3a
MESAPPYDRDRDQGFYGGSNGQIAQLQAAATGRRAEGQKTPVEFNHAINYVNKIKVSLLFEVLAHFETRFADKPDIYKNFLEILQTYQREQRPIQEVYSQVTRLFEGAPDLLDDFKQFLPDTSAQGGGAPLPGGRSMPPVGSFAPPASTMAPKKKRLSHPIEPIAMGGSRVGTKVFPFAMLMQRSKHRHPAQPEMEHIDATLVPQFPEPLGPPPKLNVTADEVSFFEKLKKGMNNKATYNEFLKLINMYTNDIIDCNTLVQRVEPFLASTSDQLIWFKSLVKYTGQDEVIDNIPAPKARVDLNHCKKFGPSYRQLPKSEAALQCSGRDDMCWEVLNDDWVSHPTWASEEGFTAHRKNQHEEALHKCEEERYEYDLNIEANLRTIQLLEPLAQRISTMTPDEKNTFKLAPGLGGSSLSIYQRVIKKIYDREKGLEVIDALHENPAAAIPVVLQRLKQKDEEWKRAQREWNKVWRDTEARNFLKSLDHMGPQFKTVDKKAINIKTLINEIEVRSRQDKDRRMNPLTPKKKYHFDYVFEDEGVIMDAGVLIAHALREAPNRPNQGEIDGMLDFLKKFLPMFFSLNEGTVDTRLSEVTDHTDGQSVAVGDDGSATPSRKRKPGRPETNLLKDVLKRTRKSKEKPVRSTAASRESTPGAEASPNGTFRETPFSEADVNGDIASFGDDDVAMNDADVEETEQEIQYAVKEAVETWIQPITVDAGRPLVKEGFSARAVNPADDFITQEIKRHVYNLFGNNAIYCFFRMFQVCLLFTANIDVIFSTP